MLPASFKPRIDAVGLELLVLTFIGLVAGALGGLLGVGGSVIMIPALTEVLGPNQHLYQAAAMIVNFFVVVPALIQHRRARAIDVAAVVRMTPLATVAVLAGVGASELPWFSDDREAYLRGLFGVFLLMLACYDLCRMLRRTSGAAPQVVPADAGRSPIEADRASPVPIYTWPRLAAVALPTGLIGGLFGVGGGMVSVPLQRRVLRMPIRSSIANSAAVMLSTSLIGAVVKNAAFAAEHGSIGRPLRIAAILIPTAILGSLYGSKLTHRLPINMVRAAFFVILTVAAIRLIYGAAKSVGLLP